MQKKWYSVIETLFGEIFFFFSVQLFHYDPGVSILYFYDCLMFWKETKCYFWCEQSYNGANPVTDPRRTGKEHYGELLVLLVLSEWAWLVARALDYSALEN